MPAILILTLLQGPGAYGSPFLQADENSAAAFRQHDEFRQHDDEALWGRSRPNIQLAMQALRQNNMAEIASFSKRERRRLVSQRAGKNGGSLFHEIARGENPQVSHIDPIMALLIRGLNAKTIRKALALQDHSGQTPEDIAKASDNIFALMLFDYLKRLHNLKINIKSAGYFTVGIFGAIGIGGMIISNPDSSFPAILLGLSATSASVAIGGCLAAFSHSRELK